MADQTPLGVNDAFDFDQSTDQAWSLFTERLAEVVSVIEDGSALTVGTEATEPDGAPGETAPWVRFTCHQRDAKENSPTLLAEASSNASLADDHQLGLDRLEQLAALGWQSPTSDGPHPTANFWTEQSQDDAEQLARLAVRTLREVFDVLHPVFLAPDQLAEVLNPAPAVLEAPAPIPSTELIAAHDAIATMPSSREHLDELVTLELTHMFGHPPLRDAEGDIAIRVGSSVVFVRPAADAHEVLVFSPLVLDVEGRSRAAEVLNDLNVESRYGRFSLVRDRVFVSISLLARPFVPAHLHEGVRIVSQLADGIDDELAAKLRGRVSFVEDDPS